MKKLILPFCAVILFATQAPVANANANEGGKTTTGINYYQSAAEYKMKLNQKYNSQKNTHQKQEVSSNTSKNTSVKEVTKKQTTTSPSTNATTPKTETVSTANNTNAVTNTATDQVAAFEEKVVELTNVERTKNGLKALQIDRPLMAAAREKSQDMKDNNYFSHTSPTFGSPFDRMKALKISYKAAGENIAKGQKSPEQVVEAWMNSAGHRANILDKNFTHIGVGYVKNGHIWTQQFIKK
ncbi:CAP domain-containing protein [Solibacillus sp. FSL W8-0474]|uniref:CAP domain-containing protein n=1 Tax=Solibacillus sp. FSL W8-0474 TaxID=2975336 RepID=UPI0030FD163A